MVTNGFVKSGTGKLAVGGSISDPGVAYRMASGVGTPFGTGNSAHGTPDTGSLIGIDAIAAGGFVYVPQGYSSNAPIVGTATVANRTLASLGLIAGTYNDRLPRDSVTVIVPGAVPEPASRAMLLPGFGAPGAALRRRTGARVAFA